MSGYAKFAGLTISRPGKYRIRVMLSTSSVNGVMTKECVDSGVIHVHAAAPAAQRPSGSFSFSFPVILSYRLHLRLLLKAPHSSFPDALACRDGNSVVLGPLGLGMFTPLIAVSGRLLMIENSSSHHGGKAATPDS
jgi:hypothetical protein